MQQLLNDAQREVVADVVNAALLASATGKPKWEVKPQVRPPVVDGSMRCMLQTCSMCWTPPLHLVSMMLRPAALMSPNRFLVYGWPWVYFGA